MTHHPFQVGTRYAAPWGQTTGTSAREVEEQVPHVGLRAQKTPPPGTRPAALSESGLQLVVEHAARPCPSCVPPLGGDCSLDDVAEQFLVAQALLESEQKALAVKERRS